MEISMKKNIILKIDENSVNKTSKINKFSTAQKNLILSFCKSVLSELDKPMKKEKFHIYDFDSMGRG
jgi:hypothetical protein